MVQSPYTYKFVARGTPRTPLTFAMHMDSWLNTKLSLNVVGDKVNFNIFAIYMIEKIVNIF